MTIEKSNLGTSKKRTSPLKTILIWNYEKSQHINKHAFTVRFQSLGPRPQEKWNHLKRGRNYAQKDDRWHTLSHVDSILSNLSSKTLVLCFKQITQKRENSTKSHNIFAFLLPLKLLNLVGKMFGSSTRGHPTNIRQSKSWCNGT